MLSESLTPPEDQTAASEKARPLVTVRAYSPEELDNETIARLGLYDIVRESNDIKDDDRVRYIAEEIFRNRTPQDKVTYVAEVSDKAVSYMVLNKWQMGLDIHDDTPAYMFLTWLAHYDAGLTESLLKSSALVAEVGGVGTVPESRGTGVQKAMWQQMAQELTPTVIIGESENPAAVAARSNALVGLDYRTFFGDTEVTPGPDSGGQATHDAESLNAAYISLGDGKDGFLESAPEFTAKDISDASSFSSAIQQAFKRLYDARTNTADGVSLTQPLISIRTDAPQRP